MSETTVDGAADHVRGRQSRILAGCCVGSYLNLATTIIFPYAIFATGIAAEAGRPAKEITSLIGPALLVTLVAQPVVGWVVNRWPARTVVLAAQALLSAVILLLAAAPARPLGFSVALAVAMALGVLSTPTVYSAYIARNFSARRGLALGVAQAFSGIGVASIPALAALVVQHFGWRGGYVAVAGLCAIALAVNWVLLPRDPPRAAPADAAPSVRSQGLLGRVVRRPIFWSLCAIFFLLAVAANGVPIFLPLMLRARGASPELAAVSLSILGVAMIVSRPLLGWLIDRWDIRLVMGIMLAGPLLGSLALLLTESAGSAYLAACGFGLAIGGEFVGLGYLVARVFGVRNYGLVYGWIAIALALGVAMGPIVIGRLSSGQDFSLALQFILASAVVALGLSVLSLREKHYAATEAG